MRDITISLPKQIEQSQQFKKKNTLKIDIRTILPFPIVTLIVAKLISIAFV